MSNINSNLAPGSGSYINFNDTVQQAPTPGQVPGSTDLSASSIKKSEEEAAMMLFLAQFPLLVPPSDPNNPSANGNKIDGVGGATGVSTQDYMKLIALKFQQVKDDVINSMLASWSKSLDEIKQRNKEDEHLREIKVLQHGGGKSATEYFTYIMSLSAGERAKELDSNQPNAIQTQFSALSNQWLSTSDPNDYAKSAFSIATVAIGTDILHGTLNSNRVSAAYDLTVSPVADAMFAVGPNSNLPTDNQGAVAMMAALLYNGARTKAEADLVAKDPAETANPQQDIKTFAMNFAQNILAIVTPQMEKSSENKEDRMGSQNKMISLMLSMMALKSLYSAYDVASSDKPLDENPDIPDNVKTTIAALLDNINDTLPADPGSREALLQNVIAYVNTKEDPKAMLQARNLLLSLQSETPNITQNRVGVA